MILAISRNRSKASVLAVVAAWVALPGMTAGCASHASRTYRLIPAPAPDYSIESGAASIRTDNFRLTVLPLDDLARAAFIHARAGGGATDPFGPGRDGAVRYLSFRLSVQNIGPSEPIVFQPQSIFIASEAGDRLLPLDFPEAYSRLAGGETSDPRFLEDLSKYLFDVGVNVPPGGSIEGLLVYPAGSKSSRKLRMEFNFIQTGGSASKSFDVFFVKEGDAKGARS